MTTQSLRVLLVCGILAATTAFQALAAAPFRIVLTSFDPFGSSHNNNSQAIVKKLAKLASALPQNIQVEICNLPVVYDTASSVAQECIDRHHPDAVVSFGEGYCSLQLETAATNWDNNSVPDNAGQQRSGSLILRSGPDRSAFGFPVQAMYCALQSDRSLVRVSADPGAFVCNNTAYHLSLKLNARHIPFTFIHVPHSGCLPREKDVSKNARIIAKMLNGAIAYLRAPGANSRMPGTRAEAEGLLKELQIQGAPACEQKFVRELISVSRDGYLPQH